MWVLRRALGLPQPAPPPRPPRHLFPTFEHGLPLLLLPAVSLDPADTVDPREVNHRKPELVCAFCPRIKAFAGAATYWSHIVCAHEEVDDSRRLAEVCRVAAVWKDYCDSQGSGPAANTAARVAQALGGALTWATVKTWSLR
jgi:hypothetical protein